MFFLFAPSPIQLSSSEIISTPVAFLAPATILSVELEGERTCRVKVSPDQLSLAIGKERQNAKLAAKLTGYKIDKKA